VLTGLDDNNQLGGSVVSKKPIDPKDPTKSTTTEVDESRTEEDRTSQRVAMRTSQRLASRTASRTASKINL
jgi:hypothetical protein